MPGFKPRFFRLLAGPYGPRVGTFKRMKIKKVKVKFALEQAMKSQRGVEVYLCSSLNVGFRWEWGVLGGADGLGTALQSRRSRVRFPMESLEFFSDLIIPVVLWPWCRFSL
jgi:hypothetical protein